MRTNASPVLMVRRLMLGISSCRAVSTMRMMSSLRLALTVFSRPSNGYREMTE
jgi:hypothetical protein